VGDPAWPCSARMRRPPARAVRAVHGWAVRGGVTGGRPRLAVQRTDEAFPFAGTGNTCGQYRWASRVGDPAWPCSARMRRPPARAVRAVHGWAVRVGGTGGRTGGRRATAAPPPPPPPPHAPTLGQCAGRGGHVRHVDARERDELAAADHGQQRHGGGHALQHRLDGGTGRQPCEFIQCRRITLPPCRTSKTYFKSTRWSIYYLLNPR
jgi:hypothetical protein